MHIAAAISTSDSHLKLAIDIDHQLKAAAPSAAPPDLLLLFISSHWQKAFDHIVTAIRGYLHPRHLLAVIAESIIGADQEIERAPAVSALAFSLNPDASIIPFHLAEDEWSDLLSEEESLHQRLHTEDLRAFFMAADPFTTPIVQLLDACSRQFPQAPIIGGMASGIAHPGEARLAIDDALFSSGLVGIAFAGNIEIDCLVSQGCRPVGPTYKITTCHKNIIDSLEGQQPLALIEQMIATLPLHDRQLLATGGLQIGRSITSSMGGGGNHESRHDFLIRPLIGIRRESGAILIGDMIQPGETLQFHVRDAKSAEEDMRLLLQGETLLAPDSAPPAGAILVTCNSRGSRFFDMPHHDVSLTRQILGNIPIAGFFAAGELGPVAQKNFIHGHTAALALFRQPTV